MLVRKSRFYCRNCMESNYEEGEVESDDSLIFCEKEWEAQA